MRKQILCRRSLTRCYWKLSRRGLLLIFRNLDKPLRTTMYLEFSLLGWNSTDRFWDSTVTFRRQWLSPSLKTSEWDLASCTITWLMRRSTWPSLESKIQESHRGSSSTDKKYRKKLVSWTFIVGKILMYRQTSISTREFLEFRMLMSLPDISTMRWNSL